ncbi:ribonuclease H family protein [Lentibacillus sp. N15]|uniref:ribonuclease H family protein n=1 Tax=Lentibacillus songyuanensis TaxID=3136161 RepID=UPI0031BA7810
MAKKFYAVKKGKKTGIFTSWDECKRNVLGVSGAVYKSFTNKSDAENFLQGTNGKTNEAPSKSEVVAYVDGSFNKVTSEFSCGAVVFFQGKEHHFSEKFNDPELAAMRNVAGEIKGSEKAMAFAAENGAKSLAIYHDYEGIAKWCTGEWQAKKEGTIAYKRYYDAMAKRMDITFVKVKGHSGDTYNDLADELAKQAFGGS